MTNEDEPLNTNSRIIRVSDAGFSVASGVVCGSCGVRSLCSRRTQPPAVCADFSPLFVFRSPLIGFDGSFNTFRLGRGMFERFKNKLGTVATLYEKRKGRVLGHARIVRVECGNMDQMLEQHAHFNHLSIGRFIGAREAPAWLHAVLLKNYKTMFKTADKNDPFTVIFMERCPAPEIADTAQEAA